MDERNLVTLKGTLDRLGFGSELNEVMEGAIKNKEPSFLLGICSYFDPPVRLSAEKGGKDFVQYILNFGHSKKTGTYKLYNYLAQLSTHNGIKRNQGFEINNDHYVTAREAYHLLLGNAVLKQVSTRKESGLHPQEKTDVWFKLNIDLPPLSADIDFQPSIRPTAFRCHRLSTPILLFSKVAAKGFS